MAIESNYDVVVAGGGPVGITFACTLKALDKNARICVLDKREVATRSHGLDIGADSVAKIQEVLAQSLQNNDPSVDTAAVQELSKIFASWRSDVVRTNTIEMKLSEVAKRLGIAVLRGKEYGIKEESVDAFLTREKPKKAISSQERKLFDRFKKAKIVVGADGSHSIIRKKVMGDKITREKVLQHLVELKFQTNGDTPARGVSEISFQASKCAAIEFETIGRVKDAAEMKPVTLHLIIDLATFKSLRKQDETGKVIKGDFEHPWSLQELKALAKTDSKVKLVLQKLRSYLAAIRDRGGRCENDKVTCIPMTVYRSDEAAKMYGKKIVLLMGDANSGVVFARGFNKGLIEVALAAQATSNCLKRWRKEQAENVAQAAGGIPLELPAEFVLYQLQTHDLFEREVAWAEFKNYGLTSVQSTLDTCITPIAQSIAKIAESAKGFFANIFSVFTSSSSSMTLTP